MAQAPRCHAIKLLKVAYKMRGVGKAAKYVRPERVPKHFQINAKKFTTIIAGSAYG